MLISAGANGLPSGSLTGAPVMASLTVAPMLTVPAETSVSAPELGSTVALDLPKDGDLLAVLVLVGHVATLPLGPLNYAGGAGAAAERGLRR